MTGELPTKGLLKERIYRTEEISSGDVFYTCISYFWRGDVSKREYAAVYYTRKGNDGIKVGDFFTDSHIWEIMPETFTLGDFVCKN